MNVPIETLHLFPELDKKLIELLRSLSSDDWNKPTLAKLWTVKDIAAHLLDGNMRAISMLGDNYFGEKPGPLNSYRDAVNFLNRLNADWVTAMKRISPQLLTSLLELTGPHYHETLKALKPFDKSPFSVGWAGEDLSLNWFHIARDFTEKWHHQQQIRHAVNKPGIMESRFFNPLINTFMQALPHTYRNVSAEENTIVNVRIGEQQWNLVHRISEWKFTADSNLTPAVTIEIEPDDSWKLFTKGISKEEATKKIIFKGNRILGEPLLSMVSVMA